MSDHEEALNSSTTPEEETPKDEKPSSRRHFVTGIATALGGGLLLASTAESNATEVRSRILSKIQEDLKRSSNELVFGYEKPDNPTDYGKYVKGDVPPVVLDRES